MSKPNEVSAGTDEIDTEVELNAVELLKLSQPGLERTRPVAAPEVPAQTRDLPSGRGMAFKPIVLSLGFLVAVAGAGGIYAHRSQNDAGKRQTAVAVPMPLVPAIPVVDAAPVGDPVRFANPFDPSEVFEFPPGTSREEARQAVAQALIERATERQSHLNARKKKS